MIYTVTFNPSLDYIVSVEDFKLGLTNRTSSELMLPGGKGGGEFKELTLTTQSYAYARVLDGKAIVAVYNNGDSPVSMEFQLPVEASGVEDLLADICDGFLTGSYITGRDIDHVEPVVL